jgi:hypothetical protein
MKLVVACLMLLVLGCQGAPAYSIAEVPGLNLAELEGGCLVKVTESAREGLGQSEFKRDYYQLRTGGKDKKEGYLQMKQLLDRVVKVLIRNKLIPDAGSLVQSKMKSQHQTKRRSWLFSIIFMVLGSGE